MMRGFATVAAFFSVVFFPWPVTVVVTLAAAIVVPLVPLAVGIFADTLYYTPHVFSLPLGTIIGALVTVLAFFFRKRFRSAAR